MDSLAYIVALRQPTTRSRLLYSIVEDVVIRTLSVPGILPESVACVLQWWCWEDSIHHAWNSSHLTVQLVENACSMYRMKCMMTDAITSNVPLERPDRRQLTACRVLTMHRTFQGLVRRRWEMAEVVFTNWRWWKEWGKMMCFGIVMGVELSVVLTRAQFSSSLMHGHPQPRVSQPIPSIFRYMIVRGYEILPYSI